MTNDDCEFFHRLDDCGSCICCWMKKEFNEHMDDVCEYADCSYNGDMGPSDEDAYMEATDYSEFYPELNEDLPTRRDDIL